MSDAITLAISNTLTNAISSSIASFASVPIDNNTLNRLLPLLSSQISSLITSKVSLDANKNLNEIPKNLLGSSNPVDLISSNINQSTLFQNIKPNLNPNLNSTITSSLSSSIDQLLVTTLPAGLNNNILNVIRSEIFNAVSKDIDKYINIALSSFTDTTLNSGIVIPPKVENIDGLFSSEDAEEGLEKYDDVYNSTVVSEALIASREFDINNDDNKTKLEVVKTGFSDPTATYPTAEYSNRQDTNKLATGDIENTIVQRKNKEKMTGAKLPGGSSWSQPDSPYKGEYPYNKVTQTETGHIIEIDDTPGAERLHIYHKTGTFIEIDSNGSIVKRAKGSSYEIIDKNGKIAISGKADISVNGACNIFVGNDATIEVEGDTNIVCHNDITAQAGGTFNLSAVESFSIRSANVYVEADKEMHIKSDNLLYINSDVMHSNATSTAYMFTKNLYNKIDESVYTQILNNLHEKIGGSTYRDAGGDINEIAGQNINMDVGGIIDMANNSAANAEESIKARFAHNSLVGLLNGRKDIAYIEIDDPSFLTMADLYVNDVEEEGASETAINKVKNQAITRGFVTRDKMDSAVASLESSSPRTENSSFITPSLDILKLTEVPDNYNLSPNFTLAMLTTKSAVSKYKLQAQGGKTYGEILFNLCCLALNICEPVLKLYPNMYVTSSLRAPGSNPTSQHPLGQAVDIQIKGLNKKDYYDVANVLAEKIAYDQLLLEYASTTNNPWIHISLDPNKNNRIQVMTFNNHAKYSNGLVNLA